MVSPEFRRVTTIVQLRGGGEEGLGEDVTYLADLHDDVPVPPVAGSWTVGSFSESLDGFRVVRRPARGQRGVRLPAVGVGERRARPRALAGRADARRRVGKVARPVTYVDSTRVTNVEPLLEVYPDARFKLDPDPDWGDETIDRLAELDRVDTADFKGVYRGSFGQPPNPELYRRIAEAFPKAWLEDPGLDDATDEVLRPHRDRITWDAPIHSVADAEALPFPPKCLNVKPSRFGTVERLFSFYEWCEAKRRRAVRRRPVRARHRADADPGARVAVPSGHAERRRAGRVQRARDSARRDAVAAAAAARFRHEVLTKACAEPR